jgi:hypothetical protein
VSNKFRRTETGCAQDEKEIVDFNWIIIIINVRLIKLLNFQKDAAGGVRNTTAKRDGVFAPELQMHLICILLWPSEHQRQSVSAKINTLI